MVIQNGVGAQKRAHPVSLFSIRVILLRQSNIVSHKGRKAIVAFAAFAFFMAENHLISLPYLYEEVSTH